MSEREEYSGDLSAYLDGELSESRRRHLDEVLKYDRELAGEMDRLRATRELIHSLPVEQPPRHFAARVVARGERMRLLGSLRQPRSYRWITLAAAAVVLVAAGLSVVIMQKLPRGQPVDTTHDKVGDVALVVEGSDNGDVAKVIDKKVDRVATPGPAKGPGKETGGYTFGKGGPLERTLDDARRAADRLSKKGAGEDDFVIYTNNLAFAQRDVENVLVYNGIHPVRAQDAEPHKNIRSRMNFFDHRQTTVSQVQYEVFASPKQAVKLKNELHVIREQQEVSQAIMPPPAVEGAIAPKAAKVGRGKTGTDTPAVEEKLAERKTQGKAKYPSAPKSADDNRDKKLAVGYDADRARRAKAEGKLIAKDKPLSKTPSEKPAERPRPTTKSDPTGAAIAAQTGEGLPLLPTTTRPVGDTLAARKTQREAPELEQRVEKRPDFGLAGESFDSQKARTAPVTTLAKVQKRLLPTQPVLAIRQPVTSQRVGQAESQIRANVTRLLITLNFRGGVRPPRSARAAEALMRMRKAASQEAVPAAKAKTNQSH